MALDFFMYSLNHSSDASATIVTRLCGMFQTMVDYGERLKEAMKDSGVDEHKLANELGVTYQAVMKVLKSGSNTFSAINHVKAARFLGVSSDWLALGIGEMRPQTGWPFPLVDEKKYRALPKSERRDIETMLVSITHFKNIDIAKSEPTDINTGS